MIIERSAGETTTVMTFVSVFFRLLFHTHVLHNNSVNVRFSTTSMDVYVSESMAIFEQLIWLRKVPPISSKATYTSNRQSTSSGESFARSLNWQLQNRAEFLFYAISLSISTSRSFSLVNDLNWFMHYLFVSWARSFKYSMSERDYIMTRGFAGNHRYHRYAILSCAMINSGTKQTLSKKETTKDLWSNKCI